MVYQHFNRSRATFKIMFSIYKAFNDCKEFLIINLIVQLSRLQLLTKECNRMPDGLCLVFRRPFFRLRQNPCNSKARSICL